MIVALDLNLSELKQRRLQEEILRNEEEQHHKQRPLPRERALSGRMSFSSFLLGPSIGQRTAIASEMSSRIGYLGDFSRVQVISLNIVLKVIHFFSFFTSLEKQKRDLGRSLFHGLFLSQLNHGH